MSKRNISYKKPEDPTFLQQLKQQIGYKEGPSVETKRQKLDELDGDFNNDERTELEDEKPQIVVVNPGDLTAEEVANEQKRLAEEAAEAPADLSKPIIFRKRNTPLDDLNLKAKVAKTNKDKQNKSRGKSPSKNIVKLSFNAEEEEEG